MKKEKEKCKRVKTTGEWERGIEIKNNGGKFKKHIRLYCIYNQAYLD